MDRYLNKWLLTENGDVFFYFVAKINNKYIGLNQFPGGAHIDVWEEDFDMYPYVKEKEPKKTVFTPQRIKQKVIIEIFFGQLGDFI